MSPKHVIRLAAMGGLLGMAALLPATTAMAQAAAAGNSVWRCGEGRYSATPCPGGVALDAADPRSAEQREQARAAAATEKRLADNLAAEREARERAAAGSAQAVNLSASKASPAAAAASASKPTADKKHRTNKAAKPRHDKKPRTAV